MHHHCPAHMEGLDARCVGGLNFFKTLKVDFHWQVRPFTLGQLKELLGRTGTLVEEAFWIDKIKSHCFVTVRQRG